MRDSLRQNLTSMNYLLLFAFSALAVSFTPFHPGATPLYATYRGTVGVRKCVQCSYIGVPGELVWSSNIFSVATTSSAYVFNMTFAYNASNTMLMHLSWPMSPYVNFPKHLENFPIQWNKCSSWHFMKNFDEYARNCDVDFGPVHGSLGIEFGVSAPNQTNSSIYYEASYFSFNTPI